MIAASVAWAKGSSVVGISAAPMRSVVLLPGSRRTPLVTVKGSNRNLRGRRLEAGGGEGGCHVGLAALVTRGAGRAALLGVVGEEAEVATQLLEVDVAVLPGVGDRRGRVGRGGGRRLPVRLGATGEQQEGETGERATHAAGVCHRGAALLGEACG